jgi:hypothetical protein
LAATITHHQTRRSSGGTRAGSKSLLLGLLLLAILTAQLRLGLHVSRHDGFNRILATGTAATGIVVAY